MSSFDINDTSTISFDDFSFDFKRKTFLTDRPYKIYLSFRFFSFFTRFSLSETLISHLSASYLDLSRLYRGTDLIDDTTTSEHNGVQL